MATEKQFTKADIEEIVRSMETTRWCEQKMAEEARAADRREKLRVTITGHAILWSVGTFLLLTADGMMVWLKKMLGQGE